MIATYFERLKQIGVDFFKVGIKLDRSGLIQDIDQLKQIDAYEEQIPNEYVGGTSYSPCPG
jgi:hypothetical protein